MQCVDKCSSGMYVDTLGKNCVDNCIGNLIDSTGKLCVTHCNENEKVENGHCV